jgi:hypothetical protein
MANGGSTIAAGRKRLPTTRRTTMTPSGWLGQWRWHGGSNDRSKANAWLRYFRLLRLVPYSPMAKPDARSWVRPSGQAWSLSRCGWQIATSSEIRFSSRRQGASDGNLQSRVTVLPQCRQRNPRGSAPRAVRILLLASDQLRLPRPAGQL